MRPPRYYSDLRLNTSFMKKTCSTSGVQAVVGGVGGLLR
jgi:hypothetical protein